MNPEASCVVKLQAQPLDIAMHEGAEPLLAVGLVDGHAQLFRYRAREEGESSSSDSDGDGDDDDDESDDDDDGDAAAEKRLLREREKRRKKRVAAAAKADQPPVRRYASSLAWSRAPSAPSSSSAPPSCRAVRFMGGGAGEGVGTGPLLLACGFGDGSLAVLDAGSGGREVWRAGPGAHGAAVSRVLPAPGLGGGGSGSLLVAGDEDGVLCVWDLRSKGGGGGGGGGGGKGGGKGGGGGTTTSAATTAATPAVRCAEHTDFISDLCAGGSRRPHILLATSGDGTLSVHDARAASSSASYAASAAAAHKKTGAAARRRRADGLVARSEPGGAEDELLSVCVARGGSKVVAGGQSGALSIFSWGEWEEGPSDRFPGHPESVDALAALDGDTLLTGSSDGLIRVIGLLPNRLMGVLGVHGDDGSPVERLAVGGGAAAAEGSGAGLLRALASSGHGECVRLWDLGCFFEEDDDDDEDAEEEEAKDEAGAAAAAGGERGRPKKKEKQDPGAAVLAAAARAAAKRGGGKEAASSSDDDDDDGSGSDSSDSDDERAGKRRRRERTRMTKQTRDGGLAAKKKAGFFAGLLGDDDE